MKTLNVWLAEYAESHQNPLNKRLHWVCVPIIYACVFGLLYALQPWLAWLGLAVAVVFYWRLSAPLALGMLLLSLLLMGLVIWLSNIWLWLVLFVLAWVGQFYGHKVEGKKPSFFKDLQFLLVGPIWLLNDLYRHYNLKT